MNKSLDDAKNELKRVDHLLYVSLKYTRTVDVLKSIIERMITCFDFGFIAILKKVKRRRKTLEVPTQPRKRCDVLKEIFPKDEKLIKFVDFYLLLRDLSQAKYTRREEYRRHVTMIADLGKEEPFEVNIDVLYEWHEKMKLFIEYLEEEVS